MRTAGDLGPSPWDRWFRTARPRAWLVAWLVTAAAAMILTPPAGGLLSGRLGAVDGGRDRLLSGLLLGLIPGLLALPVLVLTRRRWVAYALAAVLAGVGLVNTARRGDVAEFFGAQGEPRPRRSRASAYRGSSRLSVAPRRVLRACRSMYSCTALRTTDCCERPSSAAWRFKAAASASVRRRVMVMPR